MPGKLYLYGAIVLAAFGLLAFTHYRAYDYGKLSERDDHAAAIGQYQKSVRKLIQDIESKNKEIAASHKTTVRIIRDAKGPCLDTRIDPPALLERLRN